jgi:hypothetical protein
MDCQQKKRKIVFLLVMIFLINLFFTASTQAEVDRGDVDSAKSLSNTLMIGALVITALVAGMVAIEVRKADAQLATPDAIDCALQPSVWFRENPEKGSKEIVSGLTYEF